MGSHFSFSFGGVPRQPCRSFNQTFTHEGHCASTKRRGGTSTRHQQHLWRSVTKGRDERTQIVGYAHGKGKRHSSFIVIAHGIDTISWQNKKEHVSDWWQNYDCAYIDIKRQPWATYWNLSLNVRVRAQPWSQSSLQCRGFAFAANSINRCPKLKTGTNYAFTGVCFFCVATSVHSLPGCSCAVQELSPKARRSFLMPQARTEKFMARSPAA